MIDGALSALAGGGLVDRRPPADMLSPASLLSERGAVLPLDHARLLSLTNGLTVYGGYFRLFGIGPGATRDMRRWNAATCWRHAWRSVQDESWMADEWRASRGRFCVEAHIRRSSGRDTESSSCASATPSDAARHSEPTSLVGRAEGWWFFGETAWGDQYAYAASDDPLSADQTVYRLDVCHLEPEPIADDFGDFVRGELTRNAVEPRDEMTVAARERLGDLDPNTQLAYLPSLMSGGEEDVANLVTLPARAAMVAAGMTRQNWALVATSMS